MSTSVKKDVVKFFEVCLLDKLFLSTQGLFKKFVWLGYYLRKKSLLSIKTILTQKLKNLYFLMFGNKNALKTIPNQTNILKQMYYSHLFDDFLTLIFQL
jgi:hypothetical protein